MTFMDQYNVLKWVIYYSVFNEEPNHVVFSQIPDRVARTFEEVSGNDKSIETRNGQDYNRVLKVPGPIS